MLKRPVSLAMALLIALGSLGAQQPSPLTTAADSLTRAFDGSGGTWPDRSDAARMRGEQRVDRVKEMLEAIPRSSLATPDEHLLYDNARETVEATIGTRVCRNHLWAFTNQFLGWHVIASNTARVQPVGTVAARERAVAVFSGIPAAIRSERAMLQRGLDSGYTAARPVIAAVLRQMEDLLPADVTQSPLYSPAVRDSSATFRATWTALLIDSVYAAARAHRDFLTNVYLPRARAEGSLATLPNGGACYTATQRAQTSLETNADSVFRDARAEIDRLHRVAGPLVKRLTGNSETSAGIIELRTSPRFTFPHRDSVLAAYRAMTALAASRFPPFVSGFAAESLAVVPYPEFQERANLPPQYIRASDDGSRPAQFLVNLSRSERMSVANAVAHEAYPGHHLQRIAAVRAAALHPVMRTIGVGGFSEGWGIYSEELAGEMGLYVSPLDSAGLFVHLLDVAVGNYLDVGYHRRGWTRAQIVDSMVVLGGRARPQAEAYADRHAATPGQLAQYYIGYRAIRSARDRAQGALGDRFDVGAFHHAVLGSGSITLASMQAKVDRWIVSAQAPRP